MTEQTTASRGPVNDMRELYALQHAIADAGGTMAPGVHKAIDALREVWDRELRRAQAEAHQYRTALQGAARAAVPAGQAPATDQPTPSRRAGLRDEIAAAIWERQNPGRRYADCEHRWQADAEADADAVLAVLYRGWPWLRAEAEDTASAEPATDRATDRDHIAEALYRHSHPGWATRYADLDRDERDTYLGRADAVLAVLPASVDRAAVLREAADECDTAGAAYTARAQNEHAAGAFALMETFLRKADEAEYVATPCDFAACEPGGEPCSTHERLMAHAEGDHELCASDCAAAPSAVVVRRATDETQGEDEAPCCSDPTCTCNQVNAAGLCDCANWDSAPTVEAQQPKETRP